MLLNITTTAPDASDLGYLLHKNPANVFERSLPFGTMRVFFPEATAQICTASLWLDLDQASLVRRHNKDTFALSQYVNDRPYVASSYLSVALAQAFGTALGGRCKDRPDRVDELWPLSASIPAVDCDAGESFIKGVFEPLGYDVKAAPIPLDTKFPEWGNSTLFSLTISASITLQDMLSHLYILLPVLENQKHYAFGEDEIAKLIDKAGDWLSVHPMKDIITRRYLRHKRQFVFDALEKLAVGTDDEEPAQTDVEVSQAKEDALDHSVRLHDLRLEAAAEALKGPNIKTVVDLGCGEGKLLRLLENDRSWNRVVGMDVSTVALQIAARKLHMDRDRASERLSLMHGSLLYRDERLAGFDAAAMVEVIEHIEPDRLEFVERTVFGYARPGRVVVTTPNADYNPHWETLPAGKMRHRDHRFEWTRNQFAEWANQNAERFGYEVTLSGIGEVDGDLGAPTQMAVFNRAGKASNA
jgi:3' terminal RNA ribose 2'-O-methyltransferase Hen1